MAENKKPVNPTSSVWSDTKAMDTLLRLGLQAGNRLDVDEPQLQMPEMPEAPKALETE